MSRSRRHTLTRRTVLACLLYGAADAALLSGSALADGLEQSPRPVPKPKNIARFTAKNPAQVVADANLGGKVSYAVACTKTGEILEVMNPLSAHPPASTAKAITTIYAMDCLGPDFQFQTQLVAIGKLEDGVLDGDLVLSGGGDPTLDSDKLFEMAAELKEMGLREIRGKFLVYGGALPSMDQIDASQPRHVGYNPAVSGLNLNFNRVYLEWKRDKDSYSVTMEGRALKVRPAVSFARTSVVERRAPVFEYASTGGQETWTVARRALGNGGGRWLPVRHPEIYAGDVFRSLARSHGLVLPYPESTKMLPAGRVLAERTSPSLRAICRAMLKYSTNLTAEVVGLTTSKALGGNVAELRGSGQRMSNWLGERHGTNKAQFVDHSGLGDQTRLSVQEMVKAMVGADQDGKGRVLRTLLKNFPTELKGSKVPWDEQVQVVAKTGTLNFVNALAGYAKTPGGRDLAFAIFASDLPRRAALGVEERERPRGSKSWARRSRAMQRELLKRWGAVYDLDA